MMRGLVIGIVATLVVIALGLYLGISMGAMPANADSKPPRLERWAASRSLHAALAREAPKGSNPVALSEANLAAGIRFTPPIVRSVTARPMGNPSSIARGLYQNPPQLAKDGVEDDPEGVTYWKVSHGIRFTGMPSFGQALHDEQIWQVALFLKHMDSLPPEAERLWKAVGFTGRDCLRVCRRRRGEDVLIRRALYRIDARASRRPCCQQDADEGRLRMSPPPPPPPAPIAPPPVVAGFAPLTSYCMASPEVSAAFSG